MWVMRERWVGDGTDCHILTPSSFGHSSTSSSFCWAAQPGSWVAQALCLALAFTTASCPQLRLELELWLQLELTSACLQLQLTQTICAPGYIIVWCPPASCWRRICTEFNPSTSQGDIPISSTGLHLFLDWRLGLRSICYIMQPDELYIWTHMEIINWKSIDEKNRWPMKILVNI